MKTTIWLTFDRKGFIKANKECPKLLSGQRCAKLSVTIPDGAFADPPILDADLTVPASALMAPQPPKPIEVEIWEQ